MTDYFSIPLTEGAQSFEIALGDNEFVFTLIYRSESRGGAWFLDLVKTDQSDGVYGIPLVLGADLLGQFQYKGFGHLYCTMTNASAERPGFSDMGQSVSLYWSE